MSIQSDFSALYEAISGHPADDQLQQVVENMQQLSGRDAKSFPSYLLTIARDLSIGQMREPTPIPKEDRGYTWLLGELTSVLPDCELIYEMGNDVFVCHRLKRAAIITSGEETFAIVSWPQTVPAQNMARVMGTFDPTVEQIRQWAYDPNLQFTTQDEELAVSHRNTMPLLIELASDPNCPKRHYILSIADGYIANVRSGHYDRALLAEARQLAVQSPLPELQAWSRELNYISEYIDAHGPVNADMARALARIIFTGRYRPTLRMEEAKLKNWWGFTTYFPNSNQAIDRLYVCGDSGALVWSRKDLTLNELAPFAEPVLRDDPLGRASE